MTAELKRDVRAMETALEAVEGAEIVLCAMRLNKPVLETAWLAHGAHVNAVGQTISRSHERQSILRPASLCLPPIRSEQLTASPYSN